MIYYSPSQLSLHALCARRWAFRYLLKIEDPQHPSSAAVGVEVDDDQVQPYLRESRPLAPRPPIGDYLPSHKIAESMLEHLPAAGSAAPGGPVLVQRHFEVPSPTWITAPDGTTSHVGFGYHGYADIWTADSVHIPRPKDAKVWGGVPGVADTKTSSNIRGDWIKTPATLLKDDQAMLYAVAALYLHRAEKPAAVDLKWVYGQSRGQPRARSVHVRVTKEQAFDAFRKIDERTQGVHRLRLAQPDPLDLPPNPDACNAFNKPCPYASRCNLSPIEITAAYAARAMPACEAEREVVQMSNPSPLAALQAMRKLVPAPAAAPAAPPPPEAPAATASPTPSAAPVAPPPTPPATSAAPTAPAPFAGINPPESALPPPAPAKKATTKAPAAPAAGDTVRAVWGPDGGVGPFEATTTVRPGETIAQALGRAYTELEEFGEAVKATKRAA